MQARFGPLVRGVLGALFGRTTYAPEHAAQVRTLSHEGTVVYLLGDHSIWPTLCLNTLLLRHRLPLARCVNGVNLFWLQSGRRLWRCLQERRLPALGPWQGGDGGPKRHQPIRRSEAIFMQHLLRGEAACVALPAPRAHLLPPVDLGDYVRALIIAQAHSPRPIIVLPHVWVGGQMRLAQPLFMADFLAAQGEEKDEVAMARRLRQTLADRFDAEEQQVTGPAPSPYALTVRRVLQHPDVRAAIAAENARTGATDVALEAQAQAHLRRIAAAYDGRVISLMDGLLRLLFWRIYDGLWVDQKGLQKITQAARRGPLIFCPAHRSHVDYLVLSYVLWQQGLPPPHIAAGQNLAFFPLGNLFRRCGAFFMRRSFTGDVLYGAVFAAYLFDLLQRGTSLEFFLEGTRSRSGKHLMPRFGLLRMLVDAWRAGVRADLHFVPLSIDYDRIIEAGSYRRELQGANKQAENLSGLWRSGKVLRSRYGQVQVQFGEPVSLAAQVAAAGLHAGPREPSEEPRWRRQVQKLGFEIMHRVAQAGSVTATAVVCTALLGHRGRAMAQHVLLSRCAELVAFLTAAQARLAPALQEPPTRVSAVLEAVQKLVDDRLVTLERAGPHEQEPLYRVLDANRVTLDYHKNALMNHFAPSAIVARVLGAMGAEPQPFIRLQEACAFVAQLLAYEFLFAAEVGPGEIFLQILRRLEQMGAVQLEDARCTVVRPERLAPLAALLDSFLQGYWITCRAAFEMRSLPLSEVQLRLRTLERLRRAYLEGEISRCEAVSRTLVQTAHQSLLRMGVLQRLDAERLGLGAAYGDDGLLRLIQRLDNLARDRL